MSLADDFFNQAKAHSECYRAGVLAGDASGRSAQKLAALIAATEATVERLWAYPEDEWSAVTRTTLRAAINAARLP